MNRFGQPTPIRNAAGEIVGDRPSSVSRVTKNVLPKCHGTDKDRPLVVTLRDGDIIAFRPAGTRREVTATAHDLYAAVMRWTANRVAFGGRHVRPTGFLGDAEKYLAAFLAGWRVVRLTSPQLTPETIAAIIGLIRPQARNGAELEEQPR